MSASHQEAMKRALVALPYGDGQLHANRAAWFNATEIGAMFDKRPIDWLRLPETIRYIEALCRHENRKSDTGLSHFTLTAPESEVRKSHFTLNAPESDTGKSRFTKRDFVKTFKGNSRKSAQGTWLHPKLAILFARWCDVDFAIWCDGVILDLLNQAPAWMAKRDDLKTLTRFMHEALHNARASLGQATLPYHYANETNLCNWAFAGAWKPIKRDSLTPEGETLLLGLIKRNTLLIAAGAPFERRKALLGASMIGGAA